MNNSTSAKPSLLHMDNQSVFELGEVTIIGRHEDCNLVLKTERGASRKHARITIENNTAILMDLGSLNGTTINSREISRPVQLVDGDIIVFDEQRYQFINTPILTEQVVDNSADVTVIANKDEIGKPESIKPAIRVVEDKNVTPFDDTEAWEIPATSRPGGDSVTPKRLQNRKEPYHPPSKPTTPWFSWTVILPSLILFMLVAFYFAYTTGLTAGLAGKIPGSP